MTKIKLTLEEADKLDECLQTVIKEINVFQESNERLMIENLGENFKESLPYLKNYYNFSILKTQVTECYRGVFNKPN